MESKTWDFASSINEADIERVGGDIKQINNYGIRLGQGSYLRYTGAPDAFNGTPDMTVEAWVLLRSRCRYAKAYMNPLVSKHGEESGWELRVSNVEQEFMATFNGTHYAARLAEQLELHRWHHVVGCMHGRSLVLYVDGKASAPKEAPEGTAFTPYSKRSLVIGSNNVWGGDRFFTGVVGRVRIAAGVIGPDGWMAPPAGLSTVFDGVPVAASAAVSSERFVKEVLPCVALYGCDAKLIGKLRCVCRAWKESIDTNLTLAKALQARGTILPEDIPAWTKQATDPKKALKEIALSEMIEATWTAPCGEGSEAAVPLVATGKYAYPGKVSRASAATTTPIVGMLGAVFPGHCGVEFAGVVDDVMYFNASESMMVEAWVRFSGDDAKRLAECPPCKFPIVSRAGEDCGWELRASATRQEFVVYLGYYGYVGYSATTLEPEKWHHIIGVFSRREIAVVVNGVVSRAVEDDVTKCTSLTHSNGPLTIARNPVEEDAFFVGEIASARVTHAVLPPCLWLRSPVDDGSAVQQQASWELPIEPQVTPLSYTLEYKSDDDEPGYQWDSE